MSEGLIVRHCSPTLAGLKPSNMFSCAYESTRELQEYIREANRILVPKGVRALVLRCQGNRALILIFRPKAVEKILKNKQAAALLKKWGYKEMRVEPCMCQLLGRFQAYDEFPHEVGLFLGYPPEDVQGFVENKACNHKCVGCWKVYGDEATAQKTFSKYKKCTDVFCSQWEKGISIERLTVAG